MARKVAAVVLLGLMAFAAVASAQTNAELMRNRKYGGHDDEKDTEKDYDSYMKSKHDYKPEEEEYKQPKHYTPNHDKHEHEPEIEFEHKKLVKAPHMLTDLGFSLEVDDGSFKSALDSISFGAGDIAASADLKSHGKVVAHALLTGMVYFSGDSGEDSAVNAMMTIAPHGDDHKGSTLIALGYIPLYQEGDDKKFSMLRKTDGARKGGDDHEGTGFTMAIVGGQGEAAGAQGTVTLREVEKRGETKYFMDFDITVPKTKKQE